MLTREIMGIFCLGIVWVTALLVAAAALKDLGDLLRIARRRFIVGTAENDLGEWTVEQTARALDAEGDEVIAFHDRGWKSEIFGGVVRDASGRAHEIAPSAPEPLRGVGSQASLKSEPLRGVGSQASLKSEPLRGVGSQASLKSEPLRGVGSQASLKSEPLRGVGSQASLKSQVWVSEDMRRAATACADVATFDEVYAQARKAKGCRREVKVRIAKGQKVFFAEPSILSTIDPRAFCSRKALLVGLFIPLELAVCGVCTWLALRLPHFGPASVVGALCCFAFFLGVTPIGVALREHIRRPHEAFLRAQWSRAALVRPEPMSAQGLTQRKT